MKDTDRIASACSDQFKERYSSLMKRNLECDIVRNVQMETKFR